MNLVGLDPRMTGEVRLKRLCLGVASIISRVPEFAETRSATPSGSLWSPKDHRSCKLSSQRAGQAPTSFITGDFWLSTRDAASAWQRANVI